MAEAENKLTDQDIKCLGHLKRVFPLLDRLRQVGCQRDKAGNRELYFDGYCKLVLLYTWNPLIGSVRTLQQVVGLKGVAKALGINRFSLGSFSESPAVFEPELLKGVIAELAKDLRALPGDPRLGDPRLGDPRLGDPRLGDPRLGDPRLGDFKAALTLVDGTVLAALPRLARAAAEGSHYCTTRNGRPLYGWRLHMQLDLKTFTPSRIDRTGARGSGPGKEGGVLAATLEPDRCHVMDGNYGDSKLFDRIIDAKSSYVARIRQCSVVEVLEDRSLSPEAVAASVVGDALVRWGGKHPMRIVTVKITPRPRRGGKDAAKPSDKLVLATNLLDLPADLVALIYQKRYSVEVFFRFFKQLVGMRHLLSQRPEGIDIQVYCAVMVCLLINLMTGRKPNKAMVNMVGFYLIGLATEQELLDHLNKPDHTGVKSRAKAELWKKLGF